MKKLMNTYTGSVDTKANWVAEFGEDVLKDLVEVIPTDDHGGWREISDESVCAYLIESIKSSDDWQDCITSADAVMRYAEACDLADHVDNKLATKIYNTLSTI